MASGPNSNIPSTSTTSESHGSNDNIPFTSTTSVRHRTNEPQSAASDEQIDILSTRQIVDRNLCTGGTGGASRQTTGNKGIVGENIQAINMQVGDNNTMNCAADPMAKLIDETKAQLEQYRKNERKLFVESPSFKKCQADRKTKRYIAIFGAPGDGKTTIGLEVLCRVQDNTDKKTIPIIIRNMEDWKRVALPSSTDQELVILFDDMLGKFTLDESLKNFWISELPKIHSFVQNKIQVIFTCRETIFCTAKNELENFELFNAKSRIHLSGPDSKDPLDEETKFDIIKKHIKLGENMKICDDRSKEVLSPIHCRISVDTLREISRKPCVGFMQMCKVFVSNSEYYSKGTKFFDGSAEFLISEIDRLRLNKCEKYKYCTLACVLVKQGLNVDQIDKDETVRKIATACKINPPFETLKFEINQAVELLTSTYLIKINDKYYFQHNSWVESVFKCFFKSNASLLVKYCEFGLIDLITTGDKYADLCALSDESQYLSLFERLVSEMKAGNVSRVFFHRCFTDANFTRKFRNWLESNKKQKKAVLMSGEPGRDLWGERDTKSSVLNWAARKCDLNFIVWVENELRQSGEWDMKEEMSLALRSACYGGNLPVCTWLLSQTGIEESGRCIADAAKSGNVDVVKTLLNSDTTFSRHVLCEGLYWACYHGHIDVCKEILTQPEVDRSRWWADCLNDAVWFGHIDVVTALMNYGKFTKDQLSRGLLTACERDHIDVFRLLLTEPGVDGGKKWGPCLIEAARREMSDRDSRFTSLLRSKGYVIPDV